MTFQLVQDQNFALGFTTQGTDHWKDLVPVIINVFIFTIIFIITIIAIIITITIVLRTFAQSLLSFISSISESLRQVRCQVQEVS